MNRRQVSMDVLRRNSGGYVGRSAFTLVELLIVVGIIAILVSILIPTISKIRTSAQTASTKAYLVSLQGAIEQYKSAFGAFPGPLPDSLPQGGTGPMAGGTFTALNVVSPTPTGYYLPTSFTAPPPTLPTGVATFNSITGTNNLVLGLYGGLYLDTTVTPAVVRYDPSRVGKGPANLSPASGKVTTAFLENANDLSWHDDGSGKVGNFVYEGGINANDCPIPSILDKYSSPMPLLYLRAAPGLAGRKMGSAPTTDLPNVVSYLPAAPAAATFPLPYNLAHVTGYTASAIGNPRNLKNRIPVNSTGHGLLYLDTTGQTTLDKSVRYPYEANAYLTDPSVSGAPRKKDEYIIISAGPDRIYGTADDITTFGEINP